MTSDVPESAGSTRLDRQQLLILLCVWTAAALIPGIITVNQPVLLAYVIWGIGFAAALALFLTIAQITKTTETWPWLAAPILPWIVDFAVPHSRLYIPVLVLATGAFAVWIYRRADINDRLLHEGVPGTGTVIGLVEPRFAGATVHDGFVRRSVRVTVERPDKAMAYEAELRDLFRVDDLPKPGDQIELQVDPKDAMRITKRPEPSLDEPSVPTDPDASDEETEALEKTEEPEETVDDPRAGGTPS